MPDSPESTVGVVDQEPTVENTKPKTSKNPETQRRIEEIAQEYQEDGMSEENALKHARKFVSRELLHGMAKRHAESARERAGYDELTGVLNKAGLNKELKRITSQARRQGSEVKVVFADMDGLKAVNDTYGHEAGDRYIKHVAEALRNALRTEDVVARYGGDEFVLLLSAPWDFKDEADENSDEKKSFDEKLMERFESSLERNPVVLADGSKISLESSFGLSRLDLNNPEESIKEADKRMYEMKQKRKSERGQKKDITTEISQDKAA